MPWSAPNHHACGHPPTQGRCPVCAEQSKRDHDARRPNATQRGYDAQWRSERAEHLTAHPWCVRCGAKATIVDHIEAHRGNRALYRDPSNRQSLCTPCHNRWKQSAEKTEAARRGEGDHFNSLSAEHRPPQRARNFVGHLRTPRSPQATVEPRQRNDGGI